MRSIGYVAEMELRPIHRCLVAGASGSMWGHTGPVPPFPVDVWASGGPEPEFKTTTVNCFQTAATYCLKLHKVDNKVFGPAGNRR